MKGFQCSQSLSIFKIKKFLQKEKEKKLNCITLLNFLRYVTDVDFFVTYEMMKFHVENANLKYQFPFQKQKLTNL